MPVLAPIQSEPSGRSRARWLSLTALAVLAAGLAMAVAFKGVPKQAAQVPARQALAAIAEIRPVQLPPLPAPAPPPEPQGPGIQFREVVEAPSTLAKQLPETCVNCWNKTHSGLGSDEASLAAALRPSGYTSPYSPEAKQFALPGNEYEGTRMGDLPASWQQCPKP
ncbi:MAG: hypothetical protein NTY77_05935 [Elusimicrobia bacterium]|nr:hypothetical protein [Elusimicrobiota bacterium]